MKKDSNDIEMSSRRQFTRAIVTAAVAAPIAASMVGCGSGSSGPPAGSTPAAGPSAGPTDRTPVTTGENPCTLTVRDGFTEISFGGPLAGEEHIPPMGFRGGSLIIDSRHKMKVAGSGNGPFTYTEDGVSDPDDQYGDIKGATVITETTADPFVKLAIFSALQPGAELLLWYQDISPTPQGDDDVTFPPVTFPDNDPDVRVRGGRGANPFKLIIKRKRMDAGKSHKSKRPNRFRHASGGGLARHFRIGQWRLVNSAGTTLVGASGDDDYSIYLRFGHFQ
ncbi:MAG: hypothetical protein ND866_04470 [Pyrinomonadaceae bacterium]|nr:hypothetical protein [Pyrinomonadaceae bacterium]